MSKGFEKSLDCAQSLLDEAKAILDRIGNREGLKKSVLQKIFGKKEYVYLQLLCGKTLMPTISYKIKLKEYSETITKMAEIGAKVCSLAIKAAAVWNSTASIVVMFGYPIPKLPNELMDKAKQFLEGLNEKS